MTVNSMVCFALVGLTLTACSKKQSSHTARQSAADSIATMVQKVAPDTANPFKSTGHQYGAPTGQIRIANLIDMNGKPAGPVDLYETARPDSTDQPIIKNLAYGELSPYVSPRAGVSGDHSYLYFYPAGSKTAPLPYGGLDNSGFVAGDQFTIALAPSTMGGQSSIGFVLVNEEGKRKPKAWVDSAHAIPSGQSMIILATANWMASDTMPIQYLTIDGTCAHAWGDVHPSDPNPAAYAKRPTMAGGDLLFPVPAGTHTLGVVVSPHGKALDTCQGQQPVGTTTLATQAGRRYLVMVYGVPSDGIKLLAAPIK